tara:strand:- start:118 stop:369 length:252 start_codon:yes stop_codon:yes gene_type:complete
MRIRNEDLNKKARMINRLLKLPKGQEYGFYQAYGKIKLVDPNDNPVTPLMTKRDLYNTLDAYVKGMEDYRDRVRIKKRFTKKR